MIIHWCNIASRARYWCNIALVTDESDAEEPWYLESGCFRHITGNAKYMDEVKKFKGGKVTSEMVDKQWSRENESFVVRIYQKW